MKKYFKKIFNAGAIGLLFQGTVVNFQGFQGLSVNSNNTSALGPSLSGFFNSNGGSLGSFFNAAFTMALSAGAILAVLELAYAGWLYMSSDAFGKKSHAKEVITNAIIGLLLLIGIYIILNQINPCILNLNIFQSLQAGASTCSY